MDGRTGSILMKKIFTEPVKPEELYEFFTYGLALDPLDWQRRWNPDIVYNTIRRRTWYVEVIWYDESITIDYQPEIKESDKSWYMHERKYLKNVYK